MIALSTSWNSWKHSKAKDIITEIKSMGFSAIELNFSLNKAIVDEMIKLKAHKAINVVSLHNFCPIPPGISRKKASPDIFSLSAVNERARQKALKYTKKTIDVASKIGAKAVVLHLGRIETKEKIRKLASLYEKPNKQAYKRLKAQMFKDRKQKAEPFFKQALKSIDELSSYAQDKKVKLGLENRYYFYEIPSIEEMQIILKAFPKPALYYWHDVGHAQVYDYLGLASHREMLDKFASHMLGVHLHDIDKIDDHRAPLKGKFDFRQLVPYINKSTLKIIEAHHPATAKEITQAKKYLEKLFR